MNHLINDFSRKELGCFVVVNGISIDDVEANFIFIISVAVKNFLQQQQRIIEEQQSLIISVEMEWKFVTQQDAMSKFTAKL